MLARSACIGKVDAGPAAIALTPRSGANFDGATAAGLEDKGGRLLLKERIDDPAERLERLAVVLCELTAE
jgi:transcription-repair coupling factor (superfamily II helicase)